MNEWIINQSSFITSYTSCVNHKVTNKMNQDMSEGSDYNGGGEEDELYDEFGNYIGPDLDSSSADISGISVVNCNKN